MSVTSYASFCFHWRKTARTLVESDRIIPGEIERSTKLSSIDNGNLIKRSVIWFEIIRVILKWKELHGYHASDEIPRLWYELVI